jgi:hypothetical protein
MRGIKIAVAMVMIKSVSRLLDESQMVKLLLGWDEEGMRKGKRLAPAVVMTPKTAKELIMNPSP